RASVYVKSMPRYGAYSDEEGAYQLAVPANTDITIIFSYTGKKEERPVNLTAGQVLEMDVTIRSIVDVDVADVVGRNDRTDPIQTIDPKIHARIPNPGGGVEALLRTTVANV